LYLFDEGYSFKKYWVWKIPILAIAISFTLYENPWLSPVSFLMLPTMLGVFYAYSRFVNSSNIIWNGKYLGVVADHFFKPLLSIAKVFERKDVKPEIKGEITSVKAFERILTGFLILVPVGFLAIQLLSSADEQFAFFVNSSWSWAVDFISWGLLWKFVVSFVLTIVLLSTAIGWSESIEYVETEEKSRVDGLIVGIVLSGLLIIYFAFLSLQLGNLVIYQLPDNFREAELMVKSGFWQLFTLAVINTGLFFIVYRKTGIRSQWILRLFIVISSLLMVSAAWKVALYSYTFGLSYEKLFACYTALFSLGVLVYLAIASCSSRRWNVVKGIAFAALWGYALATISPVEKLIFHTNLYLAEKNNTRIELNQLSQLSLDVFTDVEKAYPTALEKDVDSSETWKAWRKDQRRDKCNRVWYEVNLSVLLACP